MMNKFYSFWFGKYEDDSYEIQMKMKYLLLCALITFLILIIAFLNNFINIFHWWQLGGDITSLIAVILILIFIKNGHPKFAVYSYSLVNISFIWHYIVQDLISERKRTLSRLYEMISLILVTIMLVGLYAIQKRQIIFHTIIGNLLVIAHFIVIMKKFYPDGDPEAFWYIFLGLIIINTGFLGSILIFNLSHNLMKLVTQADKEKLDALAQVVDNFLPICANCKAIRQEDGSWESIEDYITNKSKDVKFSHGLCPTCANKLYNNLESNI
ncbi:MAG: hypothetical protein ACTSW3_11030 [Promethearchaeota archaeon]